MGPYQRTPFSKLLARAMRYSGFFGVREKWVLLEISWTLTMYLTQFKVDGVWLPHRIHVWYAIFTYIYHKCKANVGEYTSPMDPMATKCWF